MLWSAVRSFGWTSLRTACVAKLVMVQVADTLRPSKKAKRLPKSIYNPGLLGGDELTQQFCASCHRGAEEFALLQSMEINNVRFQPYRIFHSKCYSDDRNISCIGMS